MQTETRTIYRWVRTRHPLVHLSLAIGGFAMLVPLLWQLLTSVKSLGESRRTPPTVWPEAWRWSNYGEVLDTIPFERQLVNTVIVAVVLTVAQVMVCALAAYAFAKLRFPGRETIFWSVLILMMIPQQLFILPQYEIMQGLGWLNSLQALIVPGIFSAFGTFLLRQFFAAIPNDIAEAALLDGAGPVRTFFSVMLPLAVPGLIALSILSIVAVWNDLLWPLIVNTQPEMMPLAAGLSTFQGQYGTNFPVLMAGSLMAAAPLLVAFFLLQRHFIQGIAHAGLKG